MEKLNQTSALPQQPAVYTLYGGRGRSRHVAYGGIAGKLRQRIIQHLVNRDSSVATGTSAAGLNVDYVTEVEWWMHPDFTDRDVRQAAEPVAFDVLDPALRSREGITDEAKGLDSTPEFRQSMADLFRGEPEGTRVLPTLREAMERISQLERRVGELEVRLVQLGERNLSNSEDKS